MKTWWSIWMLLLTVTVCRGEDPAFEDATRTQVSASSVDVPLPAPATSGEYAFTLQDVQMLAMRNNPTLSAAAARMNAAQGRQVQAGLYPNPVVGYHGTEIGNLGTSGQQGGFVIQKFITGGKLKLDQAAEGQKVNETHFRFHAQEQRVLTDVQIRFYEALAAQNRVQLTTELLRISTDLVQATERLLQGRQRTENDLLQAQIRADETEILLDNSRNELNEAWRRLMFVVGTPLVRVRSLDGDLTKDGAQLDWDQAFGMLLARHPELSAAKARAKRARILITRAKREPIPNIDMMVSVRHIDLTGSDVANVQVGVPVPIFDRNQGNIAAAESEWIAACREISRIELQLQDRLATTYRRYANARQQSEKYEQRIVPNAKRSLELVTKGYELGQVEYLTLLLAQQTYLQARLAALDSLKELRTSEALIAGQLLDGSLADATTR